MNRRAFAVSAATAARRTLANRGAFAVSLGFYLVVTGILSSLWRIAAEARGGSIVGYSAVALTWYIATSEAVTISLNARMIEETGDDIVSGAVAVELLRPVRSLVVRVALEVGQALPRLGAIIVFGAAYAWAFGGAPLHGAAALLSIPSMVLAITCNLVGQHGFAALTFWVRESRTAWFLYQKLVFVVGGMLMPLEVLPDGLETVARFLPFMAMAYAPARLAAGHFEPVLLLVQLAWLAAIALAATAVFTRGEERLRVVGG